MSDFCLLSSRVNISCGNRKPFFIIIVTAGHFAHAKLLTVYDTRVNCNTIRKVMYVYRHILVVDLIRINRPQNIIVQWHHMPT